MPVEENVFLFRLLFLILRRPRNIVQLLDGLLPAIKLLLHVGLVNLEQIPK